MSQKLKVDYFHDVICGWCYVLSPRLRLLADELNLDVYHHTFALSPNKEHMKQNFGSLAQAKETILGHWQQCALADDQDRINVEGMRKQSFDYPTSHLGLLACKAAQIQTGEQGHWDYFDAVQDAHMSENRNIDDPEVLINLAEIQGLNVQQFTHDLNNPQREIELSQDKELAQKMGITSVPSLVINQRWQISGAQSLEDLRQQLIQIREDIK